MDDWIHGVCSGMVLGRNMALEDWRNGSHGGNAYGREY